MTMIAGLTFGWTGLVSSYLFKVLNASRRGDGGRGDG
jgi:hypothetical protein